MISDRVGGDDTLDSGVDRSRRSIRVLMYIKANLLILDWCKWLRDGVCMKLVAENDLLLGTLLARARKSRVTMCLARGTPMAASLFYFSSSGWLSYQKEEPGP